MLSCDRSDREWSTRIFQSTTAFRSRADFKGLRKNNLVELALRFVPDLAAND